MTSIDTAHHAARRASESEWADRLARLGFCARGVVYIVVGLIALQVASSGSDDSEANKEGALREISERPLSGLLLTVLAVGLAGYALWRLTEALWGKRDEHDERKRTIKRLGSAGRAALYVAFLVSTVRFMQRGPQEGKGGEQEQGWTAQVLDLPGGRWIVGLVAIALLGAGAYIAYRGLAQKFAKRLDTSDMGPVTGRTVDVLGTIGMAARGAIVSLAGYLLLRAALDFDPKQAQGLDGTLKVIAQQAYGQVLLSLVAIGIIAYGLYSFAEARYRQL
jgi:hypothetical protein